MRFNRLLMIIIFLVLFTFWSYLLYLNPGKVDTTLPLLETYSVPIIVYITIPLILFGLLFLFFVMGMKDYFLDILASRKTKQKARYEKLFSDGVFLMNSDKPREAIPIFKKVVSAGKDFGEVKLQLGRAYRKMGDFDEALKWDLSARQSEGNKINVLKSLEKDYSSLNRMDEATHTLKVMLDMDPDNIYILHRVRDMSIDNKNWSQAFEHQKQIIKNTKKKEDLKKETELLLGIQYELAQNLFESKKYDDALKLLKEVSRVDINFVPANVLIGDIFESKEDFHGAIKHWTKSFLQTQASIFLSKINLSHLKKDKPEDLLKLYKEQLGKALNTPLVKFHLAALKIRLGLLDEAFNEFDEIITTKIDFPSLHFYFGELYLQRGEYKKSSEEYKKFIEGLERSGIVYSCRSCQARMTKWAGRCPRCKSWNTVSFDALEKLTPEQIKEIQPPKREYDYSSRLIIDEGDTEF